MKTVEHKQKHSKKHSISEITDTSDLISQLIQLESKDLNHKKKRKSRTNDSVSNVATPKKRKLDVSSSAPLVSVKIERKSSSEDEHQASNKNIEISIPTIQPKTEPLFNFEKELEKIKVKREKTVSPPPKAKKVKVPKPMVKNESSSDEEVSLPKPKQTIRSKKNLSAVKEEKPDSELDTSGHSKAKVSTKKSAFKNTTLHSESSDEDAASAKKASKVKSTLKNQINEVRTPFKNRNQMFTSTPSVPKSSSSATSKEPTLLGRQNGTIRNVQNKYSDSSSSENEVLTQTKTLGPKHVETSDSDSSSREPTSQTQQVNHAAKLKPESPKQQQRNRNENIRHSSQIVQMPKPLKTDGTSSSSEEDAPAPIKTNSIKLIQHKDNTSDESESSEDEKPKAQIPTKHDPLKRQTIETEKLLKTQRKHSDSGTSSEDDDASIPQSLRQQEINKIAQNSTNMSDSSESSEDEQPTKKAQSTTPQDARAAKRTEKNAQVPKPMKEESKAPSDSSSSSEEEEVKVPKPLKLEQKTITSDESEISEEEQPVKKAQLPQQTRAAKQTDGKANNKKIVDTVKNIKVPKPIKNENKTPSDSSSSEDEQPIKKAQLTMGQQTRAAKQTVGSISKANNKKIVDTVKNIKVLKPIKNEKKTPSDSSSSSEEEKDTISKLEHKGSTSDESESSEDEQPVKKAQLTKGQHTQVAKQTDNKANNKKIVDKVKNIKVPKPIKNEKNTPSDSSSSSEEEKDTISKLEHKASTSDESESSEDEQPVKNAQLKTPQDTRAPKKADRKENTEKVPKPIKTQVKTPSDSSSSSEEETNTTPAKFSSKDSTSDESESSEDEKSVRVKNKQVVAQEQKANKLKVSSSKRRKSSSSESSASSVEEDKHVPMKLQSETTRLMPNNDSTSESSEDERPPKIKLEENASKSTHSSKTAPKSKSNKSKVRQSSSSSDSSASSAEDQFVPNKVKDGQVVSSKPGDGIQTTHQLRAIEDSVPKKSKVTLSIRQKSTSSGSSASSEDEKQFVPKSTKKERDHRLLQNKDTASDNSEDEDSEKAPKAALEKKGKSKKKDREIPQPNISEYHRHSSEDEEEKYNFVLNSLSAKHPTQKSVDNSEESPEKEPNSQTLPLKDKKVQQVPKPIKADSELEPLKTELETSYKRHFEEKWIQKLQTKHPNIKRKTIKIEMPDTDTDCYLLRLPKNVDPTSLIKLKCNFDQETKFTLNNENWLFKPLPKNPEPMVLGLNQPQLVNIKKVVVLQQEEQKKLVNDIVVTKRENVPLPNALKTRHPLFGVNYKKKIRLDDTTQRKIIEAKEHLIKMEKKLRKKKHKHKHKDDFTLDEQGILDIFNASNFDNREREETTSHTSKKHKRKREETIFEDVEMPEVKSKKRKRKSEGDVDTSFENVSKKRKS